MRLDFSFLRDRKRVAAIIIIALCGAAIATWILARGDLVGADARAYWGGVRLWLGGGDPLDPPPPYLPYVYWSWSLPLFLPWAALPWETAWFVYRVINVALFVWSAAWAYQRRPLSTAIAVLIVTPALAATLDTGNITFMCAMGIWAAHFVSPRLGGLMWALAAALKWFPAVLFLILKPRTRLWGLVWAALFGVLTLAVWPSAIRQLELVINFPRPLRIDYLLLMWAAVPWLWGHPRWFEYRSWPQQIGRARADIRGSIGLWWRSPRRAASAWQASVAFVRGFLGIGPPRQTGSQPASLLSTSESSEPAR